MVDNVQRFIGRHGKPYAYLRPSPQQKALGLRRVRLDPSRATEHAAEIIAEWTSGAAQAKRQDMQRHAAVLVKSAQDRAKKRGQAVGITAAWIEDRLCFCDFACEITRIPFDMSKGATRVSPYRPSLDRIDATGGYEEGNVRLVCAAVNAALGQWGDAVFYRIAAAAVAAKSGRDVFTGAVNPRKRNV